MVGGHHGHRRAWAGGRGALPLPRRCELGVRDDTVTVGVRGIEEGRLRRRLPISLLGAVAILELSELEEARLS